ncbi:vitamin B12 transporter [Methylohalomonas lacus]|uniref:Vitamin B12 transporter n=1 Tax=Methylohalomonas lacus TaxID=398773 RepID=A0AAE3L157_9GAMM|nr:TonB-dependent vitamin B12 receptor [Methylohalomonas lacus]MCS3902681.1 vitamin B12 transporter [Methylohalomonas lacus]
MYFNNKFLMVLPLLWTASLVQAQDSGSGSYRTDPVMVTASRTAQHQSEALSATTVIDRQEIERLQANSVADLLQGRAGIAMANNGGLGKETSLFLRGSDSDQTLFLIDGVRFSSATTGKAAIQDIPIEQIERIEIVKGPGSSLYGADAVGGVVQIFTRDGKDSRGLRPSFSASFGSNDLTRVTGGLSGGDGDSWFSANVSQTNSNGFDTCGGRFNDRFQCSNPADLDDDGYGNQSINLRAGHRFGDRAEFDFTIFQANSENEFDSGDTVADNSQQVISGRAKVTPVDFWDVSLQVARNRDESDNSFSSGLETMFNTERHTVTLQNDFTLARRQLLTVGLDYYDDKLETSNSLDGRSRDNSAGFAQYLGHWGRHHVKGSLRHDDNEDFGSETTGSLGYGFDLTENLTLRASYGTAFRPPTFNDLFFPGFGNPDLVPETSESFEVGLDGWHGPVSWSLSAYQTDIDDLIVNAPDATAMFGISPQNVGEARIRGLEASARVQLNHWLINAQADWLDPENRGAGANHGNVLPRRHQQSLRIDADRQFQDFSLGASWQLVGRRYDGIENETRLGGYGLLDLRGQYELSRDWTIQARLSNVLDKEYETAAGFEQADREFLFTVRYQPQ